MEYVDPALLAEGQELIGKTFSRSNELIDGLPTSSETDGQMTESWNEAYKLLMSLLRKADKWIDAAPVPA